MTDANGLATSPPLVANATPGRFTAVASTDGVSAVATYVLDNHASNETLSLVGATTQRATIDTRFAKPLSARLLDASGQSIEGVPVTFSLGPTSANGAGGAAQSTPPGATFATGSNQPTMLTDSNGLATSPRFTDNGSSGDFNATATTAGITTPLAFALRNLPAKLLIRRSISTAPVDSHYRNPLIARVWGAHGRPIDGVNVTFTITSSSSGASATFPDGSKQTSVLTNAHGKAASPPLIANTTAGSFAATAAISGTSTLARATLRNLASRPTAVTAGAASGESTPISQRFLVPLVVTVSDRYGNPVGDHPVTFTAPAAGPSGLFTISLRRRGEQRSHRRRARVATVKTGTNGIAVAPPFTADDTAGGYIVKASAKGSNAYASFALVNNTE
jgi:hypothetical protein